MAKTLGYLLTWTTYGTWLQGDQRGYVKDGVTFLANPSLQQANRQLQAQDTILLTKPQQQIVREAILKEAQSLKQQIYALAVKSTHIHIVAEYIPKPISAVVAYYKKAGRMALKTHGHNGELWTKGYDKRFCFDSTALEQKIKYVQNHNKNI
jgi:REP element-mobilizing transposase RayT